MKLRCATLVLLLAAASGAPAAVQHGTVSHVTDGDTVWVRPAGGGAPLEVRLLHIDAPEGCQAGGAQAREALAARLRGERVRLRSRGRDDYDRLLAVLHHREEDVNAWLVRQGYAWSSGLRSRPGPYARLEREARSARRGLWATPGAIPPRSFRRQHGRCP